MVRKINLLNKQLMKKLGKVIIAIIILTSLASCSHHYIDSGVMYSSENLADAREVNLKRN
jgi:hypothetical protein